jgi:hypothetical protein
VKSDLSGLASAWNEAGKPAGGVLTGYIQLPSGTADWNGSKSMNLRNCRPSSGSSDVLVRPATSIWRAWPSGKIAALYFGSFSTAM